MGRKQSDAESTCCASFILLLLGVGSCFVVYTCLSTLLKPTSMSSDFDSFHLVEGNGELGLGNGGCCRGIEGLELWGAAVKWGSDFKVNSSKECCEACKAMCSGNAGPCLCDTWVFCGNKESCGSKFGECWLKKQKDNLAPDRQEARDKVSWTSGLVFGRGEGIIGLETEYGTLHIKLFPDCAPHSVAYILELLALRLCAGCQFYRAEGRGTSWDSSGNHVKGASFGPPFALIQGRLEAQGETFKRIPEEDCPTIRRGSIAWIGSGPEFFISLANHEEWKRAYTVFGFVLPEDMGIAEKIAELPTKSDVWNNINVSVLEKPVHLSLKRIKSSLEDSNLNDNVGS
ncbi:Cyclophilin-type peptidyl-prolyl cis-trans isomerase domain [Dillenia turbinata]|uniref:Cyclophilin-type peptidyl-prolyl cis-trans isomerase domain n=1 Tax=Dillenia turbinata TaxID=194707 RepID=A0AAN8VJ82_9MAGN